MENKIINLAVVAEIAEALKGYNTKMVFVGGSVVSLYTDDPAADEIRPTGDVDMTLNVVSLSNWSVNSKRFRAVRFSPRPFWSRQLLLYVQRYSS